MNKTEFYSGVLAVMDVIYSFDGDPTATLAVELIRTMDAKELLKVAKDNEYYNLDLLKKTIKASK
jgi:hypothetical protein